MHRTFATLAGAREVAAGRQDGNPKDVRFFHKQNAMTRCRSFVACTPEEMYIHYRSCTPSDKFHVHECIVDGQPCNVFFDIDIETSCNKGMDFLGEVNKLLEEFSNMMMEFGITFGRDNYILLDASHAQKFSMHITVRLLSMALLLSVVKYES